MNWDRAVTILIILFCIINAFLLTVLLHSSQSSMQISEEVIQNTVEALARQDIQFAADAIPAEKYEDKSPLMMNVMSEPDTLAIWLLGNDFQKEETDADSLSLLYRTEDQELRFDTEGLSYSFSKTIVPVTEADLSACRERIEGFLQNLDLREQDRMVVKEYFESGIYVMQISPRWDDRQVLGTVLELRSDAEAVVSLQGNWFVPTGEVQAQDEPLLDITSVLIRLNTLEDACEKQFVDARLCYYVPAEYLDSKTVSALPIYVFTESGGQQYLFDARSGTFIQQIS